MIQNKSSVTLNENKIANNSVSVTTNNKMNSQSPTVSSSSSLESFLKSHILSKESAKDLLTHTEFGKYSNRSFSIPEEDEKEFEILYYRDVIKAKKEHNLIERQLIERDKSPGPLLVDIDFRFAAELTERQYNRNHIEIILQEYLVNFTNAFEMDEEVRIPIFILEKPAPRLVIKDSGNFVKDGIHIIFGLSLESIYHRIFREKVLASVPEKCTDIPITNSGGWTDVLDDSISNGRNGWLKYMSKKRDDPACYKVTMAYEVWYNMDSGCWVKDRISVENEESFLAKYYRMLSARYRDFPSLFAKESFSREIQKYESEHRSPKYALPTHTHKPSCGGGVGGAGGGLLNDEESFMSGLGQRISNATLRTIQNREELNLCLESFLDNLTPQEYELREAYLYTMILPAKYYGEGSYNHWIKVGFALKNISSKLLIVWLAFSAQSKTFDFRTQIGDLCDKWQKFDIYHEGVTKNSIMYWAKNDADDRFEQVRENTVDFHLDQTIESITIDQLNNPRKKNAKGCSDFDIATVLYHLFKDDFVSISIRGNEWYQFSNHRWVKNDSGTTLRKFISTKLRDIYRKKAETIFAKSLSMDPESEEYKLVSGRATKILDIAMILGSTKDKDNIMKEARELFYNPEFLERLDQNKYLLCFNNGVIDFKDKIFRKGYPEDYISKCTNIDYFPLQPAIHQPVMNEICEYLHKVFPIDELYHYMWDHLSSILIGDTALNQCLHYYTGVGQNGKSMLVKFMQMILGTYAADLDVAFFTNERPKRGQSTPELFAIIGARFTVTSEPSEGDKLNEGPMKQLTSGTDKMSCRAPYGQLISFMPQANSIIMANHFLDIKSQDHGTWRRVRVVDFVSLFTDNPVKGDPNKPYQFAKIEKFDDKFEEWKSVFMAMLVQRAFETGGVVKVCPMVTASSNRYREKQDFLAEFIGEKVARDVNGRIRRRELCETFNDWYRSTYGGRVNKTKELYAFMDKQFGNSKDNCWNGVKIVYDYETGGNGGGGGMGDMRCHSSLSKATTDIDEEEDEIEMSDL
jgi:P4 family phage/plasmid primase-like protien